MEFHIYADETGCLTFRRPQGTSKDQNISKYFILCSAALASPAIGDGFMQLRRELAAEGKIEGAFHATKDTEEVRELAFDFIAAQEIRIDSTIFEKSKAQPQICVDDVTFYKYVWFYHLKYLANYLISSHSDVCFTSASIGIKKKQAAFRDALNDVSRQVLNHANYSAIFTPCAVEPCLQIADYCAWAIGRKWEKGQTHYYDKIRHLIVSEWDNWQPGRVHYY